MLQFAKLIPIFCLVLLLQMMPFGNTEVQAAPKKLKVKLSKDYFLIKPGETVSVPVEVEKLSAEDKIELQIKTSPLSVRTQEDSVDSNKMVHNATIFVTAPESAANQGQVYTLIMTATNGKGKSKKIKVTFNTNEPTPDANYHVSSASYVDDYEGRPTQLFIGGIGFDSSARVIVNGKDISDKIIAITPAQIEFKGVTEADFNFNGDANEIIVDVNGRVSNRFILDQDLSNNF